MVESCFGNDKKSLDLSTDSENMKFIFVKLKIFDSVFTCNILKISQNWS